MSAQNGSASSASSNASGSIANSSPESAINKNDAISSVERVSILKSPIPTVAPTSVNEASTIRNKHVALRAMFSANHPKISAARLLNYHGIPGIETVVDELAKWEVDSSDILAKAWIMESMVQASAARRRDELINGAECFKDIKRLKLDEKI